MKLFFLIILILSSVNAKNNNEVFQIANSLMEKEKYNEAVKAYKHQNN